MKKKPSNSTPIGVALLISVVVLVIFLIYWDQCNAKASIKDAEDKVLGVVSQAIGTKYDARFEPAVESAKMALSADRYARAKPELTKAFNEFVSTWNKRKGDSSDYFG